MSTPNSGAWRRYNIFISSTFKDMDFERDVIKFRVIPALNRRFRDRRVELQAIDLRLGVNTADMTEEESERKVLSVCTSCIDSARPFFIGLVGKRYGWSPSVERWKEFIARLTEEERKVLEETAGCSVTEMEIVYGALSQGSFDTSHVLFYLRDDASYEGLPAELRPAFCDSDPENLRKLEALKNKVQRLFGERGGEDDRCTSYRLFWKDGRFEGDEFEEMVTRQLERQIELETAREQAEGADAWWVKEKELEESTLLRLLPVSVESFLYVDPEAVDEDDEEAWQQAVDDDRFDRVVWYVPGSGASTHMAQEYVELKDDPSSVCLLAVFGLSEYGQSMRPVLVRWIHELAEACGREELPADELLLGRMPDVELNDLFASLVEEVRDRDKYIYLFLDDMEALELTAAKDLYMPWLDRVEDQVNVMVNLQDEREAWDKFLSAHPSLARKMVALIRDAEDAAKLIAHYEKTYFLELPAGVRQAMIDRSAAEDDCLVPVTVHSVFRLFESLTQEDFRTIRSRGGSQIEAINDYLMELWEEMPDSPYELMFFMVDKVLANMGLGDTWKDAFDVLAAAPSGLREGDIAHFVGAEWSEVPFYRAMNFLQDFFYEDRPRHLWRAKYFTPPEDGLQDKQRALSAYILTLDPGDSLRETMGLYYALKSGETAHFTPYLVEGDYLHGQQMTDMVRLHGPQIRQLCREGFFEDEAFGEFCLSLEPSARLQLFMDIISGLGDLPQQWQELVVRVADWLEDVDPESLPTVDAFAYASVMAFRMDSVDHLEKALRAARLCMDRGFESAKRLYLGVGYTLIPLYQQRWKRSRAEALRAELAAVQAGEQGIQGRIEALKPLLAQACGAFLKKRSIALMDQFFETYYALVDPLEGNWDNIMAVFKTTPFLRYAFGTLLKHREYERLLQAAVRFLPWMQRFCGYDGFFSSASALDLFIFFHGNLGSAAKGLLDKKAPGADILERIRVISYTATLEAGVRLKEIDPEHTAVDNMRDTLVGINADVIASEWGKQGLEGMTLENVDDRIGALGRQWQESR